MSEDKARAIGDHRAAELRSYRLLIVIGQQLRRLTDDLLRDDGVTAQQATLLTVVKALGRPALADVAAALTTSHQNVKQIAVALERKGLLKIVHDADDARVRRLVTTAKNERYWKTRGPFDVETIARWFSPLSKAESVALVTLLAKLHEGLGVDVERATRKA